MGARLTYEHCYPETQDTQLTTLQKILQCGAGSGGGGNGDDCETCNFIGSGSPEGVVTAEPGSRYYDTANDAHYVKVSTSGDTGWMAYIV